MKLSDPQQWVLNIMDTYGCAVYVRPFTIGYHLWDIKNPKNRIANNQPQHLRALRPSLADLEVLEHNGFLVRTDMPTLWGYDLQLTPEGREKAKELGASG